MRTRNALLVLSATALAAVAAAAQQPTSRSATKPAATAQAPTKAKTTAKTAAATALPVSADSARKVVMANAAGATITSTRLHRNAGKAYYAVSYHMKGSRKTMHADVDANSGTFTATPTTPAATRAPAKKPS